MEIKFTIINNLRIEYTSLGRGEDLLFLHGGCGSFRSYRLFLNATSKYYKVWALSLPGAGKSSNFPRKWKFRDYASVINQFCKKFKIKPFLAGHSFGGAVSILTKANFPNKYKRIILLSSAGVHQKTPYRVVFKVIYKSMKGFFQITSWKNGFVSDAFMNIFYHPIDMFRIATIFKKTDLENDIKKIQERVLILWGKDDVTLPLSQLDIFRKLLKNKKVYVLKGDHDFINFKNEDVADIIHQELNND